MSASNTGRLLCLQDQEVLDKGEDGGGSDIEIDPNEVDYQELASYFGMNTYFGTNIREYYSNTCQDPRFFEYLNRGPPEYYSNRYSANTGMPNADMFSKELNGEFHPFQFWKPPQAK